MRFIYYNPGETSIMVSYLPSQTSDVSHVVIPANSKLELPTPALDLYVPHKLQRINEHGQDISQLVIANRSAEASVRKSFEEVKKSVDESTAKLPEEGAKTEEAIKAKEPVAPKTATSKKS